MSPVARFEGAEETVFAARNAGAVLIFCTAPHCLPLAELEGKAKMGRSVTAPMNNE